MCYHIWGDEDFDWKSLSKAETWIGKMHKRAVGKWPITKEKYGTIRYEAEFLWLDKPLVFFEIVKRATIKFPSVAPEIVSDLVYSIEAEDTKFSAGYYLGYFTGISEGETIAEKRHPFLKNKQDYTDEDENEEA
jgi:hypothetical protein